MNIAQSVFVTPALVEIAHSIGAFDRYGIDVTTTNTTSSVSQRADLDRGVVQVGLTASDNLFAWNADGSDIVLVGQIETATDLALTVRAGLGPLVDAGRVRLAVDAPTNGFAIVAYAMLADLGMAERYEVVETGGVRERLEALAGADVDVTLLAPPLDRIALRRGMTIETRVSDWLPSYPGLGIVTSRRTLEHSREEVVRYLGALSHANDWMRASSTSEIAARLVGTGIEGDALASVIARIPDTLAPSVDGFRTLDRLRRETGRIVQNAPSLESLVDASVFASIAEPPTH